MSLFLGPEVFVVDRERLSAIFGERLRLARERKRHPNGRRWTQADLANALGAKPNTVNGWENGRGLPPKPTRMAAARVLDVPVEWIEGETEDPSLSTTTEAFAPNPAFRRRLPPRAYELVYGYLAQLEALNLPTHSIEEAERFLVDGAYNKLNSRDLRDRNEDDMVKDIRAAWQFVKDVLGTKGRGLRD
jgi:transcriptional regulator with XRE-family HTH domain